MTCSCELDFCCPVESASCRLFLSRMSQQTNTSLLLDWTSQTLWAETQKAPSTSQACTNAYYLTMWIPSLQDNNRRIIHVDTISFFLYYYLYFLLILSMVKIYKNKWLGLPNSTQKIPNVHRWHVNSSNTHSVSTLHQSILQRQVYPKVWLVCINTPTHCWWGLFLVLAAEAKLGQKLWGSDPTASLISHFQFIGEPETNNPDHFSTCTRTTTLPSQTKTSSHGK